MRPLPRGKAYTSCLVRELSRETASLKNIMGVRGMEINNGFRKTWKIMIRTLLTLLIIIVLYMVVQLLLYPKQPPSLFGYQPFSVLSNSMNPTFETGDMVIVKRLAPAEIQENDVITFKKGTNQYITHRVNEVVSHQGNIQFVTKGDNNNVIDESMVTANKVMGKQVATIPHAGYIAKFISGPVGFILLIVLPFTGYICLEVYERISRTTNEDATNQKNEL